GLIGRDACREPLFRFELEVQVDLALQIAVAVGWAHVTSPASARGPSRVPVTAIATLPGSTASGPSGSADTASALARPVSPPRPTRYSLPVGDAAGPDRGIRAPPGARLPRWPGCVWRCRGRGRARRAACEG